MRRTRDRHRCPGGHALAPHGADTAPGNTGRIRPAGPGGRGTLADRPERHRTRRSEPRPKPASKRPRGKPVTRRAAPCSAPAATPPEGRYRPRRGRPVPRACDRLGPWPPSRRRRPGKNKDVALPTQLSVPTTGPARWTRRPPEPDPHPRGRFRSSKRTRELRPVRTPGRVREPDEHRVRFDAFALPVTIIGGFFGRATIMLKL